MTPRHLVRLTVSRALVDADGVAYQELPCSVTPDRWDADAPLAERRLAAKVCRRACPALVDCLALRREMGGKASGVMAGKIMPRSARELLVMQEDSDVARWAEAAGVTIPPIAVDHEEAG